jgi:hypothetical protein
METEEYLHVIGMGSEADWEAQLGPGPLPW